MSFSNFEKKAIFYQNELLSIIYGYQPYPSLIGGDIKTWRIDTVFALFQTNSTFYDCR